MADPLQQFAIVNLTPPLEVGGVSLAVTNSALAMLASVTVAALLLGLGARKRALIPGPWQGASEIIYEFTARIVRDNAGEDARPYFPFVLTLFLFILAGNVIGLLPASFTFTSHIAVTFALAAFVFLGVTLVGIMKHGLGFLKLFVPGGVPVLMLPFMVVIELLSYLSRPVSLSLRLFANMMAGHIMLKVFAGFVFTLGLAGIFPLAVATLLTVFEVLVAFLQAYVFAILTCLYLHDALHPH